MTAALSVGIKKRNGWNARQLFSRRCSSMSLRSGSQCKQLSTTSTTTTPPHHYPTSRVLWRWQSAEAWLCPRAHGADPPQKRKYCILAKVRHEISHRGKKKKNHSSKYQKNDICCVFLINTFLDHNEVSELWIRIRTLILGKFGLLQLSPKVLECSIWYLQTLRRKIKI